MKKKIIVALALVVLVVLSGWWILSPKRLEAGRGIFISGNIEATEVDLAFRISGQISSFPVEEGDRIRGGEVIAELDTDTLLAMKGAAQAEIAALHAVLDELQEGTRKEEIEVARAGAEGGREPARQCPGGI